MWNVTAVQCVESTLWLTIFFSRAKELAEIRNSLRPFEQADSMVVGLRTVSSLSTESSTNSVCSTDGFTTSSSTSNNNVHQLQGQGGQQGVNNPNSVCSTDGFSSVQDALSRLNQAGFDEVSQMEHFYFYNSKASEDWKVLRIGWGVYWGTEWMLSEE